MSKSFLRGGGLGKDVSGNRGQTVAALRAPPATSSAIAANHRRRLRNCDVARSYLRPNVLDHSLQTGVELDFRLPPDRPCIRDIAQVGDRFARHIRAIFRLGISVEVLANKTIDLVDRKVLSAAEIKYFIEDLIAVDAEQVEVVDIVHVDEVAAFRAVAEDNGLFAGKKLDDEGAHHGRHGAAIVLARAIHIQVTEAHHIQPKNC